MHRYVIRREIPGAGKMTPAELKAASQTSCDVLHKMGVGIQWVQSYVTDDTIHCVYLAENEDLIREHAQKSGFPATEVMTVATIIDPTTAG